MKIKVQPGDCLDSISDRYGLPPTRIWDHPENQELKDLRGDGTCLAQGDDVFIPALESEQASAPTQKRHQFVRRFTRTRLRVRFLDDGEPRSDVPYLLAFEDGEQRGAADGAGVVDVILPSAIEHVLLRLDPDGLAEDYEFDVGHLEPIDEIGGAQARLQNLGYYHGKIDGIAGKQTRNAVRQFQLDRDLPVTAALDDATLTALDDAYGEN